uniref:Core domain-containing protein n=1 Tax=Apophlaea sinclairii TaxID=212746 RepID=A0A1C9CBK9_9FLOR|nr:hypothetical protein Apop_093 [Apophlaea sinclairii]AOM65783.1 hypothetical protein Apop_093 [Apophlaea sinclairii]
MNTQDNQKIIFITHNAASAIIKLRKNNDNLILLRIGVKQGGCSGMSYTMHVESQANITQNDKVINYLNFKIVCNFKSLLLLYGLCLDYSNELVGGGFSFTNPNAIQTCGCGKSFNVDKM